MIGATLVITFLSIAFAMCCRSAGAALGVVVFSMLAWPEYLRIPLGLAEMSVPRLVALVLLLKFFSQGKHRDIGYGKVDVLVVLIWLWTILAATLAGAENSHITQMIGRSFDTVLMYFVARIALSTPEDGRGFYFFLAITAALMCCAGVYEAVTASSPYQTLQAHRSWSWIDKPAQYRLGLFRAQASTAVYIYFGMAMMLVMGFTLSLRGYVGRRFVHKLIVIAALLAALSSMSSGPWIACFLLIALHVYANRPHLIKPSIFGLVFLAAVLEIASNRHFYNLIDYLALDPATAWYRTRLLEIAASRLGEFWLIGVGSTWPHHWADVLDGRDHIDVVNHFLIVALYGGLPAMFMYIATHVIAIKQVARAWRADASEPRRMLLFGLAATLLALDASSMSVGLFGPPLLLSHMLLGFMVSASTAWSAEKNAAPQVDDGQNMQNPGAASDRWNTV